MSDFCQIHVFQGPTAPPVSKALSVHLCQVHDWCPNPWFTVESGIPSIPALLRGLSLTIVLEGQLEDVPRPPGESRKVQ